MFTETPAPESEDLRQAERQERLSSVVNFAASAAFHLGLILIMLFIVTPGRENRKESFEMTFVPKNIVDNHETMIPSKLVEHGTHSDRFAQRPTTPMPNPHRPIAPTVSEGELSFPLSPSGKLGEPKLGFGKRNRGKGSPDPVFPTRAAKRVVFLIDKSGSMFDFFDHLRVHLAQVVTDMKPYQKFELIFFDERAEAWQGRLVNASGGRKRAASRFMNGIVTNGQTKPDRAIRMALALKPDLMFILSDGEFDAKVVSLIAKLNKGRKTQINTLYAHEHEGGRADNLRRIAQENRGRYRRIGTGDLGMPARRPRPQPRGYTPMSAHVYPVAYTVDRWQ